MYVVPDTTSGRLGFLGHTRFLREGFPPSSQRKRDRSLVWVSPGSDVVGTDGRCYLGTWDQSPLSSFEPSMIRARGTSVFISTETRGDPRTVKCTSTFSGTQVHGPLDVKLITRNPLDFKTVGRGSRILGGISLSLTSHPR